MSIITVEQAREKGITPESLIRVAEWNEEKSEKSNYKDQKERTAYQAAKLREVADELEDLDYYL